MANRYWVGGSGTWDSANTANWSATSGGAGGASVPTSTDSVFFDQATTYTVTISGFVYSLDATISAGTVTFSGGNPYWYIYGNFTSVSTTITSSIINAYFIATTAKTITTNNAVNMQNFRIFVDMNGGSLTMGSAMRCWGITISNGTFSTSASNYSLNPGLGFEIAANGNTKVLSLNASSISVGYNILNNQSTAGFTFNAGTSTITSGGAGPFYPNTQIISLNQALTFYNVIINDTYYQSIHFNSPLGLTFNNLTISSNKTNLYSRMFLYQNITINGTLTAEGTVSGATPFNRLMIVSDIFGTARTITAASVVLRDVDFMDITGAGAASWTGTRLGNAGGNTNITFPAAKTVYYVAATLGDWASANWSTTSGGATASTNFPLPQDTAIINNSSGTGTLTFSAIADFAHTVGTVDISTRTTVMTLSFTGGPLIVGSLRLSSAVTVSGTGSTQGSYRSPTNWGQSSSLIFGGQSSHSITSSGKSFTISIIIAKPGATLTLNDAFTCTSSVAVALRIGTLALSSFTFTSVAFESTISNTRSINFGTGNITITGSGNSWQVTETNFTTLGTPVVNVNNPTSSLAIVSTGLLSEANAISFNITSGNYTLLLAGNYKSLNFTGFSGILFLWSGDVALYGSVVFSTGMTTPSTSTALTFAATSSTQTITTNGKTLDFPITQNGVGGTLQLLDALIMGSTRTFSHTNGTLDLNGKTLTVGTSYTVNTGTKNLTFNGGTLICTGTSSAFNNANPTGFTTTAGTGTGKISFTSSSSKTFAGGGSTYNCNVSNDGIGNFTITGSNTFTTLSNTVQPATIRFENGSTNTVTNLSMDGINGSLVSLSSTSSGSTATLSKALGTVTVNFLLLSDITVTGGATWNLDTNCFCVSSVSGFNAPYAQAFASFM